VTGPVAAGEVMRRAPRNPARRHAATAIVRAGSVPQTAPEPPPAMSPPPASLRIERLVLDGPVLEPLQAGQLRTALELELAELLQREPLAPVSQHQDRLRAPPLSAASAGPAGLGLDIARSLHAGLAGTGTRPE